jgi:hypothetical protein
VRCADVLWFRSSPVQYCDQRGNFAGALVRAGDDCLSLWERLRARILAQAAWVQEHRGIYKVMHESKVGMP